MAEIIPSLNRTVLARMTAGERRVARRLEALLEDDYLVWYDIPVGSQRRYPDFIVLHPGRGLLFLEVKDWKASTVRKMRQSDVELLTDKGLVSQPHPLEQARQYAYATVNMLARDEQLCQHGNGHQGKLAMPYGWGVIFTNISRAQIEKGTPADIRERLLPDHLVMYKEDLAEGVDAEAFQEKLWSMFNYRFGEKLSLPQIDRIRWHLFPELRIEDTQGDLFDDSDDPALEKTLPDIIRIMDIQQEQLARSLGEGHRVIHGVAGSGKTLILGYRCLYLAQALARPILVLCFNISLAAKLRQFISARGIDHRVQVYHFHDWCSEQLRCYQVDLLPGTRPHWEKAVLSVIDAVDRGQIPRGQYGALLIDEGHDFEPDWLKLVVQMVDPTSNSLLLLYDDAQSIYKKGSGLGFSLSSVGIEAKGRTTILRINYRNTREILDFAYRFARNYFSAADADDDHIPLVEPQAAGVNGPAPVFRQMAGLQQEIDFSIRCVQKWHAQGMAWSDMAMLYADGSHGAMLAKSLKAAKLPHLWMGSKQYKQAYDPTADRITVLSMHSSKGLEFPAVIMVGVGELADDDEHQLRNARLLYVGMTRAQQKLLVLASGDNEFSKRLAGQPESAEAYTG